MWTLVLWVWWLKEWNNGVLLGFLDCIYIVYISSKEKGLESDELNGSVHEVTRYMKVHLFFILKKMAS